MGLYFLFCGYFLPSSCDRHGFQGFISAKFPHLGIPLLFFTVLCSVVTGHVEVVTSGLSNACFSIRWYMPFLVCRAQTHARAERGERGVDRFAVIIVSAANYRVRPA